ncbi:MAG: glycosyltransferase [Oscillospiraceae bacterium]|nr:glycosyltransferase [Oscillospiraceae bacterium]
MAKKKNKKRKIAQSAKLRSGDGVRLSQCMIVKNEEQNIEKALGWARGIAFEQIVVDTGSTDRTVEIAEKMGAKVYHFEWIKDFAAAKNYAIEQATGNWIAFLDADEYITASDAKKVMPLLRHIQADRDLRERYLAVCCPWIQIGDEGKTMQVLVQERIFRNLPEVRYVGSIHEKLSLEVKNVVSTEDFQIMHTGYTTESFVQTGKASRNIEMLRAELLKNPKNIEAKAYLAEALNSAYLTGTAGHSDAPAAEEILKEIEKLYTEVVNSDITIQAERKKKAYAHFLDRYIKSPDTDPMYEKISEKAFLEYPDDGKIMCYRAAALNKKGDWQAALDILTECEAKVNNSAGVVLAAMNNEVRALLPGQMVLAAQGLGDTELVIKYAGNLLTMDKQNIAILRPYIATLMEQGLSPDEAAELLSKIYDMSDSKDLLLIERAAKDCKADELAHKIMKMKDLPAAVKQGVRLSQCMIVKNEEQNIEKALGWARGIAFEQIVVDTGSTDRTVEIAEKMGAKVYHFEWIKDFAAAKNYAIEQAAGNWIAFLDADEYFEPEDAGKVLPILEKIQGDRALRERYLAVCCPWIQLSDEKIPIIEGEQARLFRNLPQMRYIGRIHEHFKIGSASTLYTRDIKIMHTGYTQSAYDRTGKSARNIDILRAELCERPDDINMKAYLADSLVGSGVSENAAEAEGLFWEIIKSRAAIAPEIRKKAYAYFLEKYADDPEINQEYEKMGERAFRDYPDDILLICYYAAALNKRKDYELAGKVLGKIAPKIQNMNSIKELMAIADAAKDCDALGIMREAMERAKLLSGKESAPSAGDIAAGGDEPAAYIAKKSSRLEEFEKEALALLDIMRNLIECGQIDDAKKLLGQYAILNPADQRIEEIKNLLNLKNGAQREAGSANQKSPGQSSKSAETLYGTSLTKEDLDKIESIFILTSIIPKRTGFFNSIFNKIKLMEERLGYKSMILTCMPDISQRQTEVWLKTFSGSQEIMSPGTRIINIYDYFQKSYKDGLENKARYRGQDDGFRYVKSSEALHDVFDGKDLVRQDFYTGYNGSLRMERHFCGGEKTKEVLYDDWGYLNNIREYTDDIDANGGERTDAKSYTIKYYTTDGKLCMEGFYSYTDEIYKGVQVENAALLELLVYDENGDVSARCKDNNELAAICLSHMISSKEDGKFHLLVFEDGLTAEIAGMLDEKITNAAKATVVHSIFLKDAYDPHSEPQMFYEYLCNNPAVFDGTVMLTKAARDDFTNMYGNSESVFVIPHPYPYEITKTGFDERDTKKAVIVARLLPEKMVEAAVDIFSTAARALPDIKLEIYGRGPEEEKIAARIRELGMENNIFLMGYTDDAIAIYRKAVLFIMTSWAEGYGLTLVESICNGCPAVAFDIKYGPSDIIENGKTGYLITRYDADQFAKKLVDYFQDAKKQREMSENCYLSAPRFSTDKFLENWLNMISKLSGKRREK